MRKSLLAALLGIGLSPTLALADFDVVDYFNPSNAPVYYTATACQKDFTIPWAFEFRAEIVVETTTDDIATSNDVTWREAELSSDYTIAAQGVNSSTLTFTNDGCNGNDDCGESGGCAEGTTVFVYRFVDPERTDDFGQTISSEALNRNFDRQEMHIQQDRNDIDRRVLRLPIEDYGKDTELPPMTPNKAGMSVCVNEDADDFVYCASGGDDLCPAGGFDLDNAVVRVDGGDGACVQQDSLVTIDDLGNTDIPTHLAVGALASTDASLGINFAESFTGTSGAYYGQQNTVSIANTAASSADVAAMNFLVTTIQSTDVNNGTISGVVGQARADSATDASTTLYGGNFSAITGQGNAGQLIGMRSRARIPSTKTGASTDALIGAWIGADFEGGGDATQMTGLVVNANATNADADVATMTGVGISLDASVGNVDNLYGLRIGAVKDAANNYAIGIQDPFSLSFTEWRLNVPNLDDSWTLTVPPNHGTAGQVLTTDGTGVTTWEDAGGGGAGSECDIHVNVFPFATSSDTLWFHEFATACSYPEDLAGSTVKAYLGGAAAPAAITINKIAAADCNPDDWNPVAAFTATFPAYTAPPDDEAALSGSATSFAIGDCIEILPPSPDDATLGPYNLWIKGSPL